MNLLNTVTNKLVVVLTLGLASTSFGYEGSSSKEVWDVVTDSPYSRLQTERVTTGKFFDRGFNLLTESAKRTVADESDILPEFNKLLHPNGICLKGTWTISEENPYTGYFKKGSEGIIVARASTTLSNTKRGSFRGFGLAGKIFPTTNEDEVVKTANFFTIDNLIGTYESNYSRAMMTNEPSMVPPPSIFAATLINVGLTAVRSFNAADSHPGIRQVYPISELANEGDVVTPKWMMVSGFRNEKTSRASDFRMEILDHIRKNEKFTMGIYVASRQTRNGKNWKRIGQIKFDQALNSYGCDHQLHFHHNKHR